MSVKKTAAEKAEKTAAVEKAAAENKAEAVPAVEAVEKAPVKKPAKKAPAKKTAAKKADGAGNAETEKKPAAHKKPAKKEKPAPEAAQVVEAAPVVEAEPASEAEPVGAAEPASEAVPVAEAVPVVETELVAEVTAAEVESAAEVTPVIEEAPAAEEAPGPETAPAEEPIVKENITEEEKVDEPVVDLPQPRRSVAFIGSECYPFIKTGGLGDVMYALPKALIKQNCDVKVILPRYACIPQKYQEKMVYRGEFMMDLCSDGRSFYVGIMEYVMDGVVYDFIDNNDFFSWGNPYTDLVYLRTLFANSPVGRAKSMITIHNLRFQGIYNIPTLQYWTGLPGYVFGYGFMKQGYEDANMLKGGLAYADMITTVSNTYAWEIQTPFYGENLDAHLRHHSGKLRGIVNGIDVDIWNSATDKLLAAPYDINDVIEKKKANKRALQESLGLEQDDGKMVIGLISRLTDQKGLDLVNAVFQQFIDGNTQIVVLGTGDGRYEDAFRWYESQNRGTVCSYISYNEGLAHQIYAGADALLVPSLFEPCGLTQLIAMRYGTVPVVRETGGLKDTVQPYNAFTNDGNGFTFDRYEAGLLLDAVNRAKTLYFTERERWDEMVQRNMAKDVSWENSAKQYRELYLQLRP